MRLLRMLLALLVVATPAMAQECEPDQELKQVPVQAEPGKRTFQLRCVQKAPASSYPDPKALPVPGSTNVGFGPELPSSHDHFNKMSSGANLLTITAGHTLDLVEAVLGPIIEVDARTEILWPAVKLTDTGEESLRETADHVAVFGKTRSGAVFTADIHGGVAPEDTRSCFEIRGSEAWLSLTSDHPYGFQAGDLKLTSNIPFPTLDEAAVSGGFRGAAINVGEVYARLVRDVYAGTHSTPGFQHALHNARLIEAVRRAAARGERHRVC